MPFIESDCTFEHQGKQYTSGGSWILECSDGHYRGIVYSDTENRRVTTWHGDIIAKAEFGRVYRGAFCRMQSVRFTLEGLLFYGRYCPDWSQSIRVRSSLIKGSQNETV